MKRLTFTIFIVTSFLLFIGCHSDVDQITSSAYSQDELTILSSHLNLPDSPLSYAVGNINTGIEVDHIATLGRTLFYDKQLSADGKISCASCHQQNLAFSDNTSFSNGPNGNTTARNSIALGSLRSFGAHYADLADDTPGLFWDERAHSIKDQLKQTINNPNEMGMELADITELMANTDYYEVLHSKAFQTKEITEDNVLEALETFINSIGSPSSKFEEEVKGQLNYISGDNVVGAIPFEKGLELFITNCSSCHGANLKLPLDLKIDNPINLANNGLELNQSDLGAFNHSQKAEDLGKFKIPGLRNIELTAPYMHDGRFETLEEVVEFYNSGITLHPNLHPSLRNGDQTKKLNLDESQKAALVEFLKSLTNDAIVNEEKWSNPFIY